MKKIFFPIVACILIIASLNLVGCNNKNQNNNDHTIYQEKEMVETQPPAPPGPPPENLPNSPSEESTLSDQEKWWKTTESVAENGEAVDEEKNANRLTILLYVGIGVGVVAVAVGTVFVVKAIKRKKEQW